MAPRDILPGSDWGEAIVEGIEGAKVFVLVFSRKANESQQVKREVERAVNRGLVIIPMRIEDVLPGRQLEYFLGTPHWLDALTAPLEAHLTYLGDTVQLFLERGDAPTPRAPVTPGRVARATPAQVAGVAVGAVVLLLFVVLLLTRSGGGGGTPAATVEGGVASGAIDSKFVGSWALVADPAEGPDQWLVTFRKDGTFEGVVTFEEKGTILSFDNTSPLPEPIGLPASRGTAQPLLTPDDGPGGLRPGTYTVNGDQVNTSGILPLDFVAFAAGANGSSIGSLTMVTFNIVSDTEWRTSLTAGKVKWDVTFTATGTKYTFRATHSEAGTYGANGGQTRTVSDTGSVIDGTYSIQPDGSLVTKNETGSGVWKRTK